MGRGPEKTYILGFLCLAGPPLNVCLMVTDLGLRLSSYLKLSPLPRMCFNKCENKEIALGSSELARWVCRLSPIASTEELHTSPV